MADVKQRKILVAFDFDHTIIDGNSDIQIRELCPDGQVPTEIQDKYTDHGWTPYMGAIFEFLHSQGYGAEDLKNCLLDLPLTDGFAELMSYLDKDIFEVIIISDSNSVFINYLLDKYDIRKVVKTIYTNPAEYDENGCLRIRFYHTQDWCMLSTENLCKGHVLQEHISKSSEKLNTEFRHVVYVGDGTNDLCPSLRLLENDYACPRKEYSLWKKLKKLGCLDGEDNELDLKANVLEWRSGLEVLELCKVLEKNDNMHIEQTEAVVN